MVVVVVVVIDDVDDDDARTYVLYPTNVCMSTG